MTRKKGIALIISLTLLVSIALPGTLAFSGDSTATNENITLAEETPIPSTEDAGEETVCTCDPQPGEGETHKEECPLYTAPEAPAEEENGCTCDPKPSEGELYGEGCPFYTPVVGTTAAAEGTDSTVTESATGHISIKINVFCVDDDGNASPQPGVPVEVRRNLSLPYYSESGESLGWSDGLSMFSGTSNDKGVVEIKVPYTAVMNESDPDQDTVYLGDGSNNNNDSIVYQRAAEKSGGYPIRFEIVPAEKSGYELNDESEKIRNWKRGINAGEIQGEESNDFVFTSGIIDGDGQENAGAFIEFDLYVKKTASAEKPIDINEEPSDINYAVADLTIKQRGEIADENQTFIYIVTGGDLPKDGIRVAVKGKSSVTIRNLKIGSYVVTEDVRWSWRYSTGSSAQDITLKSGQTNEVSFTSTGTNFKWLSGNAYSVL